MFNMVLYRLRLLYLKILVYFNEDNYIDEYRYKLICLPYCIAVLSASFSPDSRLKVGSVLFKGSKVYNSNFNSKPIVDSTFNDCVDPKTNKSCNELLHSEVKTIISSMIDIRKVNPALLITHAPCLRCAAVILESGITEVWYCGEHDNNEGVRFLQKNGVTLHNYTDRLHHLNIFYRKVFTSLVLHNQVINLSKIRSLIY